MIKSFQNEAARAAWERRFVKGVPQDVLRIGNRKLLQLHNARSLNDLRAPPGNRLEALSGKRKGQHSIRINDQWRVCFVWEDGDAYRVEIVDYHS
jgi:proteic killer suppression protein